ncbi:MAG: hypothetical protein U5K37_06205 [Natrialbaceae archaeon]|nr:hypothetical protein [Natrialbaceae archaeon]
MPVAAFETTLFHSVLIQAVGSGLVIGQLKYNRLRHGLKYSVALVAVGLLGVLVV